MAKAKTALRIETIELFEDIMIQLIHPLWSAYEIQGLQAHPYHF